MSPGMTVSAYDASIVGTPLLSPGIHPVAMSRPQVGIERLPTRRMSNEPRESMNCKSCRKRKIKCNRLRPSCEACQVFQCPCIYDAVPKKRGPKTDVLEALLKRVDGLEQKLKEKKADDPSSDDASPTQEEDSGPGPAAPAAPAGPMTKLSVNVPNLAATDSAESPHCSPVAASPPSPEVHTDALLDTYFSRFHAKPYHILDESSVRQRLQLGQIPPYLMHAIYAVASRYTPHPKGYQAAVKLSEDYAARARGEIDTDEPSVDALQALLLLVTAFTASGKGKKAYMLLTNAVGMAMALELHREMDAHARVTPVEREVRRRLFWTCYLLDRFMACGSKRPCLIGDKTILLRLPCWSLGPATLPVEGQFFYSGSNLQHLQGSGNKSQGSSGMLIDISRILGVTNRYLAAGGVKGDSHFPWHSLSNLSKIRQELDVWASGSEEVFSSLDSLFGQPDSTVLVLSKLIYHLIHCLIYRPFLPIDLAELAEAGQHQSWQITATNMCFLHANAIAELVELGKQTPVIEWPAFVGYCICTAGTVHIHGAHYNKSGIAGDMNVFTSSAEFLSREMQQLSELRYAWASIQHQRETLQGIYNAHSELAKALASNPMRYAPVFHLEDFFDRYSNIGGPGGQTFNFDAANLSLSDVMVDFATDTYTGHDLYAPRTNGTASNLGPPSAATGSSSLDGRPSLKRKKTNPPVMKREQPGLQLLTAGHMSLSQGLPTSTHRQSFSGQSFQPPLTSPGILHTPMSGLLEHGQDGSFPDPSANNAAAAAAAAAGFSLSPHHTMPLSTGFSPQFGHTGLPGAGGPSQQRQQQPQPGRPETPSNGLSAYDPMFGGMPTNAFSSPAAWHGGDDVKAPPAPSNGGVIAAGSGLPHSPDESQGTGQGEEPDPFLSLLEQLAENAHVKGPGNELDFFLSGAPNMG